MGFQTRLVSLLAISASLAIAAGCSGTSSQSISPISPLSERALSLTTPRTAAACGTKVSFISDPLHSDIFVFSGSSLCATLTGHRISEPSGMDVDSKGNLWVANFGGSNLLEFAPPYTGAPLKTIADPGFNPGGVAVCRDYIAIANTSSSGGTNVMTLRNGKLTKLLADPNVTDEAFPVCDPAGDLFVSGIDRSSHSFIDEWNLGKGTPKELSAIQSAISNIGGLDWEGTSLWVLDQLNKTVTEWPAPFTAPATTISLQGAQAPITIKVDASDKLIATSDHALGSGVDGAVYTVTGLQKSLLTSGVTPAFPSGVSWNHDDQ